MNINIFKSKVGEFLDVKFQTEINDIFITGEIIFIKKFYDWRFSGLCSSRSDDIASNLLRIKDVPTVSINMGLDLSQNIYMLSKQIDEKWGVRENDWFEPHNKYNCQIYIIKNEGLFYVLKFIIRKINKSIFSCLIYSGEELLEITDQVFGGWDYAIGTTIESYLKYSLQEINRNKLKVFIENIKNIDINNLGVSEKDDLIVFDIETTQFSENFVKFQKAKKPLPIEDYPDIKVICCIYIINGVVFEKSFLSNEVQAFYELVKKFKKVISFNGINFDFPVIQKSFGFEKPIKISGKHFDVFEYLYKATNKKLSLDSLVRFNLFSEKMVKGKDMNSLSLDRLTVACFSDVKQTYLIYRLINSKSLILPYGEGEFSESYDELPLVNKTDIQCRTCKKEKLKVENLKSISGEFYDIAYCVECLTIRRIE